MTAFLPIKLFYLRNSFSEAVLCPTARSQVHTQQLLSVSSKNIFVLSYSVSKSSPLGLFALDDLVRLSQLVSKKQGLKLEACRLGKMWGGVSSNRVEDAGELPSC